MYIIAIGWLYVALMMSVAEATNTTGTVLGAVITFLLYGAGPVALVMYILGTPARRKAIRAREAQEAEMLRAGTSIEITSPVRTSASGPPIWDSGETCRMQAP